jgi:hypothetical protein
VAIVVKTNDKTLYYAIGLELISRAEKEIITDKNLFEKCDTCIIQACCSDVCSDYLEFIKKEYNCGVGFVPANRKQLDSVIIKLLKERNEK